MISRCIPAAEAFVMTTSKPFSKISGNGDFPPAANRILADYAAHNGISKAKALECLKDNARQQRPLKIRQQPTG